MKNLREEIMEKFELNEIQKLAMENIGENLILDAPTASGKTEAILLSIKEGSNVTWMLPTISACTFMYRRLCADFNNLNVEISTSTMMKSRHLNNSFTSINIITCDPMMIDYIKTYVDENRNVRTTDEVLVLDEIDNYPTKVRTVLKHYIKNVDLKQVILASATLDDELKSVKKDFKVIKFSKISNKIRYKADTISYFGDVVDDIIIPNYKKKKIGVILNSISEMDLLAGYIQEHMKLDCMEDMNIIYHHSGLANEIKLENERRLFEKEYELLISNDLISTSVDVDLDILIMGWSDKLNMNIQRMGRLNRRGKKVSFTNLYILDKGSYPIFIDEDVAEELLRRLNLVGENPIKLITSDRIADWSNQVVLDDISFEDVLEEVKDKIAKDEEIVLRDIPSTFRYETIEVLQKRKKGKKIKAVRKTLTVDKKMNNIPWTYYDPCSEEDGVRDLLYLPWMYDIKHPSGVHSNIWKIDRYDKESGIRHIIPYDGPQYPLPSNDDEDWKDKVVEEIDYLDIDNYTEEDLSSDNQDPDDYRLGCDSLYVVNYDGYSDILNLETIKKVIVDLLAFSNKLSKYQKWSPFSNKETIYRRANIVLEKVFKKYNINYSMDWMRSVSNEISKNPDLINDKIISILFWVDEEEVLYMNKEWLGYAKILKSFIIENIEKKVDRFERYKLRLNQINIIKKYDGNHIVNGVYYDDKLYYFKDYDFFDDYIVDNNLNIIEDARCFRGAYLSYGNKHKINTHTKDIFTNNNLSELYSKNSINKAYEVLNEISEYCKEKSDNSRLDPIVIEIDSEYLLEHFFIDEDSIGRKYNPSMVIYSKLNTLDENYFSDGRYLGGFAQVLSVERNENDNDIIGYNLNWLSLLPGMKEFILGNCVKDIKEKYPYVQFDKFEFDYEVVGRNKYNEEIHKPARVKYMDLEWKVFGDVIFDYTNDVNYSSKRKEIVEKYVYSDGFYSTMCSTNYTANKTEEVLLNQGVKLLINEDGNSNPLFDTIDRLMEIHKEESKGWGRNREYMYCEYANAEHYKNHEGKILRRLYEETGNTVKDILESLAYLRANNEIEPIKGYYAWYHYHCLDKLFYESDVSNDIIFNIEYLSLPYSVVEFVEDVITPELKERYGKDYYIEWNKLRSITGMEDGKPDMMIGLFYEVDPSESWLQFYFKNN